MPGRDRTLRLQHGNRIEALCVLGTHIHADVYGAAPVGAVSFSVKHTEGVSVEVLCRGQAEVESLPSSGTRRPLAKGTVLRFSMSQASTEVNDNKVTVSFYAEEGKPIDQAGVFLTGIGISLDVDADQDGVVEKNSPNKASWTWGPEGHGAILLVSCDKESSLTPSSDRDNERVFNKEDLLDMSPMVLRTEGPQRLPRGYEIILYISVHDADKVGVFHVQNPFFGQRYVHVLGRRKLYYTVHYTGGTAELDFFVEGLCFPDDTFSGLVSIHLSLLETLSEGIPHTPVFTDTVVFRVAPWIMTPNTLAPISVFVCSMKDNYLFTKEIQNLVNKAGCKLKVCFGYINRGDRWMQDDIEFGYTHAPNKSFPVVLDSPREKGLEQLPVKELLGPDFGYVNKEPLFEAITSLDSFGNLEVSPPVTVAGKEYPLGRILIGSSFPTSAGRRMTRMVRDFLYAQQVQAPVELYSDWLAVGYINEFITFVPTSDKKRFRMLMASPAACYKLFREKQKEGQGEATMFKGYSGTDTKRLTINKVLSNDILAQQNQHVQRCIDWNRDILKKELGLMEEDIIDLPTLFKLDKQGKAVPYFPNTVTMIVLAKDLGIPKPFGPVLGGECCLEQQIRCLLEPLGLCCHFLEDVSSYHGSLGEVHCGTNVQRRPFAFKWWHITP
ncbi:PREDICTED: protein-arginine deiminase type-2 [Acanthisitta chloris]|uniref:protein-arginine deiminase type-2 n=1 Tax=Acanthisitta chloris TaxID=57068 RepID=UPI0004F0F6E1|nr:PREDICTED: protein-arginine deiminase type-2 [Acanthisitta chloris]